MPEGTGWQSRFPRDFLRFLGFDAAINGKPRSESVTALTSFGTCFRRLDRTLAFRHNGNTIDGLSILDHFQQSFEFEELRYGQHSVWATEI